MKLKPTLILFCICVAAGCATSRNQSGNDKLAAQYSRLKRPIDKAVFCLNHSDFFFRAPSDAEFRSVFGQDAELPSATTNVVMNADKPEWMANVQQRTVRIRLIDEQDNGWGQIPRSGPLEEIAGGEEGAGKTGKRQIARQLPPPWVCVAHYAGQQLVWLYVQPFKESK